MNEEKRKKESLYRAELAATSQERVYYEGYTKGKINAKEKKIKEYIIKRKK